MTNITKINLFKRIEKDKTMTEDFPSGSIPQVNTDNTLGILDTDGMSLSDWIDKKIEDAESTFELLDSDGNFIKGGIVPISSTLTAEAPDARITIEGRRGEIILQDSIPSNSSKTFTVNTQLPVVNTEGDEVGTESRDEIIVGDSTLIAKDTADNIIGVLDLRAEETREVTFPDSVHIVEDQDGNTLIEANILALQHKTSEIWAKEYRPLIFRYNTSLTGDNEIRLGGTGNYEKHITIKDMQGDTLEEYWTTDSNVINTNHPIGEYFVEVRQRKGNYYKSNISVVTNQVNTLTDIFQFGDVVWDTGILSNLYRNCSQLIISARDEMNFRGDGDITSLDFAFSGIREFTETTWLERFPWGRVKGSAQYLFDNDPYFAKDTLELDFRGADIMYATHFFRAYQMGGTNGIQTLIIKNMESSTKLMGNILSNGDWSNGMQKVIFQGLQVSQDMTTWRPTDPINIMLFFLNLGDRTREVQSTITMRKEEWILLSPEQQDVTHKILVNKNWALALQ